MNLTLKLVGNTIVLISAWVKLIIVDISPIHMTIVVSRSVGMLMKQKGTQGGEGIEMTAARSPELRLANE